MAVQNPVHLEVSVCGNDRGIRRDPGKKTGLCVGTGYLQWARRRNLGGGVKWNLRCCICFLYSPHGFAKEGPGVLTMALILGNRRCGGFKGSVPC